MDDFEYNWKVVEDDGEGNVKDTMFESMTTAFAYYGKVETNRHPNASTTIHIVNED